MTTIGFYEARTRFSELLDAVANGKQILITRRGKPAAIIAPPPKQKSADVSEVVNEMLRLRDREGPTLGGEITIRQLIEEGRRF
jgi:prevent-host-death family protein